MIITHHTTTGISQDAVHLDVDPFRSISIRQEDLFLHVGLPSGIGEQFHLTQLDDALMLLPAVESGLERGYHVGTLGPVIMLFSRRPHISSIHLSCCLCN